MRLKTKTATCIYPQKVCFERFSSKDIRLDPNHSIRSSRTIPITKIFVVTVPASAKLIAEGFTASAK